jgi:EAL domain-containing protein (putative c-di-GMP-specific phosphodiesterase class I)
MAKQQPEEALKLPTFGQRKMASRVCVVDGKPHVRKFLCETLEEIGFIACDCAHVAALDVALDEPLGVDLIVVGSANGVQAATVVEALAAKAFGGKVLLLGPRNSSSVAAVGQLGTQRGIEMLPPLITPFDSTSLHESVAAFARKEAQRAPVIDATEALDAGWLELWYQPKFNARTLQLCGVEALIRVRHPSWGLVPPAYFMPDRDDPCLSVLSNFVVNRAIEDWHYFTTQHRAVQIAVNLPFDFFRDPDWVMNLCGRMPNHPAFDGLIVEINAADLIADLDLARAVARRVRFSNIAVSVDDLGAECVSLVGLDNFPFVEVKVDRQFVAGCADDRLKRTACRQILDIADGFGCRTVAQGVETRADFFAVREMDFDMVQGFLFAKPMTAQKFALTSLRKPVTIPD